MCSMHFNHAVARAGFRAQCLPEDANSLHVAAEQGEPVVAARIVHVSADFPDPADEAKTPVIRSLLELTRDGFHHHVISINRRTPNAAELIRSLPRPGGGWRPAVACTPFPYGISAVYGAPPMGILHAVMLRGLGDWLADEISRGGKPDLIVGHKLAFEGIAVRRAATRLGIPFAITIQGNSDCRVLEARPDLRAELGRVFHDAAAVTAFAPWALARVEAACGKRSGPTFTLPCPTDLDTPLAPVAGGRGLISVFHLRNHKTKNLRRMALATQHPDAGESGIELGIVGGGSDADLAQCRALAGSAGSVIFEGPLDRAPLHARMNQAAGLVMPSLRESFGLVFIEALFAGIPVIYPAGAAIDGYFDNAPFAISVDARSVADIARAMRRMIDHEHEMKAALREWQAGAHARQFTRPAIAATFARALNAACNRDGQAAL